MRQVGSLSHSRWECKYHVVFIPKYRKKAIFGQIRAELGEAFRRLAEQKESRIEEGHVMPDHVHMMISIPPKYAVASVIGYIKGKSAIHIARMFGERKRNFVGQSCTSAKHLGQGQLFAKRQFWFLTKPPSGLGTPSSFVPSFFA